MRNYIQTIKMQIPCALRIECLIFEGQEMKSSETMMPTMGSFFARALATSCLLTALIAGGNLTVRAQAPADEKDAPPSPHAQSPQLSLIHI